MSRYPSPLYDQFTAELNLKLKSQENDIKIINIWCDLTPIRQNMEFQLMLRWFAYGSLRVVFLR
jgi:hypothetical protein